MNDWEYKIVTVDSLHEPDILEWIRGFRDGTAEVQDLLDQLGREGWELVSFLPARPANQIVENSVTGQKITIDANPWLYHAIFKRPAETAEEADQRLEHQRLLKRARGRLSI